mgnify:CR=1 FL=1
MINITVGLTFLTPWLSLFILWWLWVFGRVGIGQTIGGTILFLALTAVSLVMIKNFLENIGLKK